MPDSASRGRQSPVAVGVLHDRMQRQRFLSGKGAVVLLILLALTAAIVTLSLRRVEAQGAAQSTQSIKSNAESLAPVSKEDSMTADATQTNDASTKPVVNADIHVNGTSIPLPESGETVHQETTQDNGTTTVDISFDSSTSGSSVQSQSTLNLNVQSDQISESEEE